MIGVVHGVLTSGSAGLTSAEARARLARDGPNELPAPKLRSPGRLLADQLFHFFAAMLWVASGLAVLAGLPALAIAIVVVIVVNALFALAQERRADHAAARLRSLLPRSVVVRRDGQRVEVDAGEVVVGDVLILTPGDRIPADALTTSARGLLVDTSMLTGERGDRRGPRRRAVRRNVRGRGRGRGRGDRDRIGDAARRDRPDDDNHSRT
jgi:magnesium-transporting ATPase (P-type)